MLCFSREKFRPCSFLSVFSQRPFRTRGIFKTAFAVRGGRTHAPGHAVCVFLGLSLFDPHENPIEETSVREKIHNYTGAKC